MKYTLEEILGNLELNELDEIMPDNFDNNLSKKSLRCIEKTALQRAGIKNNRRRFNFKIFAPVAACLALVVSIGAMSVILPARKKMPAEWKSDNVKTITETVSRNITLTRHSGDNPAEVIRLSVPGVEILREEPAPEDSAALWDGNQSSTGIKYQWNYEYQFGAEYSEWDKVIVECQRNGKTLWKTEFPTLGKNWGDDEFSVRDCIMTSAGTAVWGERTHWSVVIDDSKSHNLDYGWIARIDDKGNKLWQIELNHGFENEHIKAVLDNGDGTWAVISDGDFEYLCLSQFDINGNELSFQKTKVNGINISNAARLGDGYLVQTNRVYTAAEINDEKDSNRGRTYLVKLDHNGNVTDSFAYEGDDCDYYIIDMAEFEGKVYLSAYAVPKQTDEGGRHEIANILDYVFSKENWVISSEELTPIVRENYTAVLLVCDPNGGEPKSFCSAKGSLGGALSVEDNQLKWNEESIVSTFFSPYTNSFSIGGKCKIYQYSFDKSGTLVGCENTGKTAGFNR